MDAANTTDATDATDVTKATDIADATNISENQTPKHTNQNQSLSTPTNIKLNKSTICVLRGDILCMIGQVLFVKSPLQALQSTVPVANCFE